MVRKVVAFAGKAGSGKDYRCKQLVNNQGYTQLAFADALRKIAFITLGIPYNEGMEKYEELKKTPILSNGLTLRNILENLGTEGIRKYDSNFWVKCLVHDIEELDDDVNVCISDLRFYNEYEGLKNHCDTYGYDFEFIFCDYRSDRYQEYNTHASARLAQFLYDIGLRDGDLISDEIMKEYINSMKELSII